MSFSKIMIACFVAALAIAVAAPAPASATPGDCLFVGNGRGRYRTAPCIVEDTVQANNKYSFIVCLPTPPGARGAFSDSSCATPFIGGSYVEAMCVYMGAGRGRYKENTCSMAEAGGPWDYIFREPRPGLTDNPQWYVDSNALLESSQSYEITATANGAQTFSATGLTKFNITCKTAKLASEARIVGSVAPAAGTSKEKIEYGECALEGKLECEINGKTGASKEAKITTANLTGKLAYSSAASAEKEEVEESSVSTSDLLLKPAEGSTFATVKFGKGGCPLETTFNIEGEELSKELGEPGIMATTHEVELLKEGTYWEDNSEKKAVSHTVSKLKGLFESISITGKLVLEVKGGEPWFITN